MDLVDKYLGESEKRWVYGTKDEKWHLVDSGDRDFKSGISQKEFKKIGKDAARKKYLKLGEAKLSARGRQELARLEKEDNKDDGEVDWRRKTLAFMSDGRILQKYDVRFTATQYSKARKHSYGWTEYLKLKKGKNPYE